MADLWKPNGNKLQTDIDIKIAALDNYISRASLDIIIVRKDLISIESELKEMDECLKQLRDNALIVSISEYDMIQKIHVKTSTARSDCLDILKSLKGSLEAFHAKRVELLGLRDESATKILEFNYDERTKKRPPNRK